MAQDALYNELKRKMQVLRQEMVEAAEHLLRTGFKSLFDEYEGLNSIGWTQYTPYFNDGDPCVFLVNNERLYINGVNPWDAEDEDYKSLVLTDDEMTRISEKAVQLLGCFEDRDLLQLFGDHCLVTIKDNGEADVETYDHE